MSLLARNVAFYPLRGSMARGLWDSHNQRRAISWPTGNVKGQSISPTDKFGSAYRQPDIGTHRIEIEGIPLLIAADDYTWSIWVKFDNTPNDIIWANSSSNRWVWYCTSTSISSYPQGIQTWTYTSPVGEWMHLGMTWDLSNVELWINGVSQGAKVSGFNSETFNKIGGYITAFPIQGQFHSAMMWERKLDDREIQWLSVPANQLSLYRRAPDEFAAEVGAPPAGGVPRLMYHHRHHNRAA